MAETTLIEIAYATPERQKIVEYEITRGCSVRDAVKMSTISQFFPEIDLDNCDLGVFGKAVPANYELLDGDRIEIYRPLIADPKEVRRQRAEQGLKTKKGGGKVEE